MQLAFPRCKTPACVAILVLLAAGSVQAATGLRSEEELLYRGSLAYSVATKEWDDNAVTRDIGCRAQNSRFSNRLEYGYSYYYTLFGDLGFASSTCGADHKSGVSDLHLGVRGRINPYLNSQSWELGATVPLSGRQAGRSRVGCGVFGVDAEVSRQDKVLPWLTLGYGATVKLWESPLAHQLGLDVSADGPIGAARSSWSWYAALAGDLPLTNGKADPAASVSDCGTESKVVRTTFQVRHVFSPAYSANCGVSVAIIGEDVSQTRGTYCAFSRLWR